MISKLAEEILEIIGDYRNHENVKISPKQVIEWVNQFSVGDRLFLLKELKQIFEKRYVSKSSANIALKNILEKLTDDCGYSEVTTFLQDTIFLDLQALGKSQTDIRDLMTEVMLAEYKFDISNCGTRSQKYYIYLDDLLCTGNSVFLHMKDWLSAPGSNGNTNFDTIKQDSAKVILVHLFIHRLNYLKLKARFKYLNSAFQYSMYRSVEVENDFDNSRSKLDYVFPIAEEQPQEVVEYFNSLGGESKVGIFRDRTKPTDETFFSSAENRIRFENILLVKGLEILKSVGNRKENIRPLGYTLPSHKNLGFGTLCFTWRNIANNVPLVFWYSSMNWKPLFEKKTYPDIGNDIIDPDLFGIFNNEAS